MVWITIGVAATRVRLLDASPEAENVISLKSSLMWPNFTGHLSQGIIPETEVRGDNKKTLYKRFDAIRLVTEHGSSKAEAARNLGS